MESKLLSELSEGSVIKYCGKKFIVRQREKHYEKHNGVMLLVSATYISPYVPYSQSNLSNEGELLPSNVFVDLIKS